MIKIKPKILKDITEYCELNKLNKDDFINDLLKRGLLIEKYGEKPFDKRQTSKKQKIVSKFVFEIPENEKPVENSETQEEPKLKITKQRRKLK